MILTNDQLGRLTEKAGYPISDHNARERGKE